VEIGDLPWIEIDFPQDLTQARESILPKVESLDRGSGLT
jgi:choline kinase